MNKTSRTTVSKSNPVVKAILALTFPEWKGRKVTVIAAASDWTYTHYIDDQTQIAIVETVQARKVGSDTIRNRDWSVVVPAHRPGATLTYGDTSKMCVVTTAIADQVVVMQSRHMGADCGVELIIPASALDDVFAQEVALDAALSGKGRTSIAALAPSCGVYTAIVGAVVEARAKAAHKAEKTSPVAALIENLSTQLWVLS